MFYYKEQQEAKELLVKAHPISNQKQKERKKLENQIQKLIHQKKKSFTTNRVGKGSLTTSLFPQQPY